MEPKRVFRGRKGILFDLDGTLIDSVPDLADAVNETMLALGRAPYEEERVRNWVGNGAKTLVKRALSEGEGKFSDERSLQEALTIFLEAYRRRLCERTVLYPGVRETLEALKGRGVRMGIVTNKPGPFVAPILERLGLSEGFDTIVGGEDLPVKKPDPMPLLHACGLMGLGREETLMVGDSINDILAAKRAGIPVVAVDWGYNYGEKISEYEPDAIVARMEELLGLLEE